VNGAAEILLDVRINEKRYGERLALHNLHLRVHQGEIVSLIGASGCGKSTLLSIISGLDREFRGNVRLGGEVQHGTTGDIGFIFQEPRLLPWLTVAQNIAFAQDGSDFNSNSMSGDVAARLAEVGLSGYAEALPKHLSGGQAQRVAIARGLFTRPRVLLLDEPFSAVDAFTRMKLQELLIGVARQHGLTVVIVTHDIDEALYLSDRVVLMGSEAGRIAEEYVLDGFGGDAGQRDRSAPGHALWKARILNDLHAAHVL
jgi:sulfonate transport system ATP-binding protein